MKVLRFMKKNGITRVNLDLDYCDGLKLNLILAKLVRCPFSEGVDFDFEDSFKGYHIRLICRCKADYPACRIVFDDPERVYRDEFRPPHARCVCYNSYRFIMPSRSAPTARDGGNRLGSSVGVKRYRTNPK